MVEYKYNQPYYKLQFSELDEEAGEIPIAHIVPNPDNPPQSDELIRFCADRISPLKTIRKIVFHETLPRTAVGKGLRRLLKTYHKKNDV